MRVSRSACLCAGVIALAAVGHHWFLLSGRANRRSRPVELAVELHELPLELNAWTGRDVPLRKDVVKLAGATTYLNRQYTGPDGGRVDLYIAYYGHVMERVPHGPTVCLPYHGWEKKQEEVITLPIRIPGFDKVEAQKLLYEKDFSQIVFLYWHAANGKQLVGGRSMYADSAWMKLKGLFGLGGGYLFQVSVSAPVTGSQDAAFRLIERFFRESFPLISKHFPRSDNRR